MKKYYQDELQDSQSRPPWMTMFISLMLVLLTLFIFLVTFTEMDKSKVEFFKQFFRESMLMPELNREGRMSITDLGTPVEPVKAIINRMKSNGINKKLMDDFLTLNQIKDFDVVDGKRGVVVVLPEVAIFEQDKSNLTRQSRQYLSSISFLVSQLPYLVEVKGYASQTVPLGYTDALEFSARRASVVYDYFLQEGVAPVKLKVSGCGDAFGQSSVSQDKVEIVFKEAEL